MSELRDKIVDIIFNQDAKIDKVEKLVKEELATFEDGAFDDRYNTFKTVKNKINEILVIDNKYLGTVLRSVEVISSNRPINEK